MWLLYIFLVVGTDCISAEQYFLTFWSTWCFPIPAPLLNSFPASALSSYPCLANQITSTPHPNVPSSRKSFWLSTAKSPKMHRATAQLNGRRRALHVIRLRFIFVLECRFLGSRNLVCFPLLCSQLYTWCEHCVNRKPVQKHTLLMQQKPKPRKVPPLGTITYPRWV